MTQTLAKSDDGLVRRDKLIEFQCLTGGHTIWRTYRRVEIWIEGKQETMVLLTNLLELAATTIAAIYKQRWQIELFFKALKQNLRIKTFVGTNADAVHVQIWTALITILLLKFLQFQARCGWALSHLVALLRWNLFSYRDLWAWLNYPLKTPPLIPPEAQLSFVLDSSHAQCCRPQPRFRFPLTPEGTPTEILGFSSCFGQQCGPTRPLLLIPNSTIL